MSYEQLSQEDRRLVEEQINRKIDSYTRDGRNLPENFIENQRQYFSQPDALQLLRENEQIRQQNRINQGLPARETEPNQITHAEYASQVYEQILDNSREIVNNTPNAPSLIIIGEQHTDFGRLDTDPAVASAYVQISALEAGRQQNENVIFSVELDETILALIQDDILRNGGTPPPERANLPIFHTIAYAMQHNITIVPSDPLSALGSNLERDMATLKILEGIAENNPNAYVVHIGGALHLKPLMTIGNEQTGVSRLEQAFGHVQYYNTHTIEPMEMESLQNRAERGEPEAIMILEAYQFYSNPENDIIQFNAPDHLQQQTGIIESVLEAAQNSHQSSTLTLEQEFAQLIEKLDLSPNIELLETTFTEQANLPKLVQSNNISIT